MMCVSVLRLCVYMRGAGPADISFLPSLSREMQSASNCASFSNLSRTDVHVTNKDRKNSISFVFRKGGGQVLADS